jgi:hypothetical protein
MGIHVNFALKTLNITKIWNFLTTLPKYLFYYVTLKCCKENKY